MHNRYYGDQAGINFKRITVAVRPSLWQRVKRWFMPSGDCGEHSTFTTGDEK